MDEVERWAGAPDRLPPCRARPIIVLVHGFIGDGRRRVGRQLRRLSDDLPVVASGRTRYRRIRGWAGLVPSSSSSRTASTGFVAQLKLGHPHVAPRLSFGGTVALEIRRRRPAVPRTLVLAGAYAGWAGSLPAGRGPERLHLSLDMSDLPARRLSPPRDAASMFSGLAAPERVRQSSRLRCGSSTRRFRAMTRAAPGGSATDARPCARSRHWCVRRSGHARPRPLAEPARGHPIHWSSWTVWVSRPSERPTLRRYGRHVPPPVPVLDGGRRGGKQVPLDGAGGDHPAGHPCRAA